MRNSLVAALTLAALAVACGSTAPPPVQPPAPPPPPPIATAPVVSARPEPMPPPPPPAPPLAELQLASLKTAVDAINAHDARKYASLFTRNAILKEAAAPDVVGKDGIASRMQILFASFSDFTFSLYRVWQKGNVVVASWRWTGTDTGGFIGKKASGRHAGLQGVSVCFYNLDGLVREIHLYEDGQTAVDQLDAKAKAGTFRAPPADPRTASPMEVIVSAGGPEEGRVLLVAKSFYDALESKREADLLALFDDDSIVDDYATPKTAKGLRDFKATYRSWNDAFGDFKGLPLYNQIAVNDYVISERVIKGTLGGPRGVPVSLHSVDIAEMKGGKISHLSIWSNTLELVVQAGARGRRKP